MIKCFRASNIFVKNQINRNKLDNKAKIYIKNIDFIPIIQNDINGNNEWEQSQKNKKLVKSIVTED